MFKSFFAALAIFLASIFGGHQITAPSQPAAGVAAVSHEAPVVPTPSLTQLNTAIGVEHWSPAAQTSQGMVLGTTTDILPNQNFAQLQDEIVALQGLVNQLFSTQHSTIYSNGAPAVQTFLGNGLGLKYFLNGTL